MDKQREEFEKLLGNEFDPEGIYWEWFKKGQTAMQPEIDKRDQRIEELEKDYAVWREYTGKVNDRNIELEDKIIIRNLHSKYILGE